MVYPRHDPVTSHQGGCQTSDKITSTEDSVASDDPRGVNARSANSVQQDLTGTDDSNENDVPLGMIV